MWWQTITNTVSSREWSLITGRGATKWEGGASEVLPVRKGGRKKF